MKNDNLQCIIKKKELLADTMGVCYSLVGATVPEFFSLFERSGYQDMFEMPDSIADGSAGAKLAFMILNKLNISHDHSLLDNNLVEVTDSNEYRIGYVLGYLQGRSLLPFRYIFKFFPPSKWYDLSTLYEDGEETIWDKTLGSIPGGVKRLYLGGAKSIFSNFYPSKIMYDGVPYLNAEAAFQATKTQDINLRKEFSNLSPSEAKRKGRKIKLRSDWEIIKFDVMVDIVRIKFNTDPFKTELLSTGNHYLIEDTTRWHDNIWGDCRCEKCKWVMGKNLLGKAWMQVRDELMASQ